MPRAKRKTVEEKGSEVEEVRKMIEPDIVDLAEAKLRLRFSGTREGRLKSAKPFPLPKSGFDIMVGPPVGMDIYEKLFGGMDGILSGAVNPEEVQKHMDVGVVKAFIKQCIVEPEVDDEFMDDLMNTHTDEFMALSAFCTAMMGQKSVDGIYERLGAMDTEAQQLFAVGLAGSMSLRTPA